MNFFVTCLVALVAAASAETPVELNLGRLLDTEKSFTMDDLDFYIDILSSFPDYTPVPAQTLLYNLDADTKQKMVETVNDIEQGKIEVPNNVTAIMEYIRERSPSYATKVDTAMTELFNMVGSMKEQSQERFLNWWGKLFEAVKGDNRGRAGRIAEFIILFQDAFEHLSAEDITELQDISPETFRLLDSNFARRLVTACKMYLQSGYEANVYLIKAPVGN